MLPGVTVTATEIGTGYQSIAVTLEDGRYRLENLPPGRYRLRIELPGFAATELPNVELLVGANATVPPIAMKVASLEETVTVSGETPLVDLRSSQVAGNIDRRQMAELPLQGRNWQELSLMVKGITANNVSNTPGAIDNQFQLNLDGQQITQRVAGSGFGQPKVSREAIAEFQIVTNMFDITQGRSTGMQVQAISRSGTNDMRASAYGFFRDDALNAPDPVADKVLPFQNQQVGATFGGPIVQNKAHFFGSFEYERQPQDVFLAPTRLPNQTFEFETKDINKNYLARVDMQESSRDNISVRFQRWEFSNPFSISSGTAHPSTADNLKSYATNLAGTWTRAISSNLMMQVQGGMNRFSWYNDAQPSMDVPFHQTPFYVPQFNIPGLTIGGASNYPNDTWQNTYSGRVDINGHKGAHDFKIGGEYLRVRDTKEWSLNRRGTYVFNTRPSDAELERRFPADAWDDPSRWDVSGLEPYLNRFDINFHPDYLIDIPRPTMALWIGDNWRATSNLTINLGVRYDADWGATDPPGVTETVIMIDNGLESGDFGFKTGIRDLNNIAPRIGFAYNPGGRGDLVIRGGSGYYYNTPVSNVTYSHQYFNQAIAATLTPDGPGFIENPTRGVSGEDYLSGAVPPPPQAPRVIASDYVMPHSWQSSIGFQKQLGSAMGVDADLTYLDERDQVRGRDPNLFYNPVTGYNLDPARFGRPNPAYGQLQWMESTGRTETLLLSSSLTRRFRNNFQGGRHLHAHAAPQRRHHRLRHRRRQPVRPRGRLVALAGVPARHVPRQRHRQPAVPDDGGRLVSLRLGHLLQCDALGAPVRQARHQPSEHRRADHDPGGRPRSLGRSGRHRHQHRVAAQRPARHAAAQGGRAVLGPHRQGGRRQRDAPRRSVQRLQLEELRQLQHAARLGLVRATRGLVGQRLRAALGATRVPARVLARRRIRPSRSRCLT